MVCDCPLLPDSACCRCHRGDCHRPTSCPTCCSLCSICCCSFSCSFCCCCCRGGRSLPAACCPCDLPCGLYCRVFAASLTRVAGEGCGRRELDHEVTGRGTLGTLRDVCVCVCHCALPVWAGRQHCNEVGIDAGDPRRWYYSKQALGSGLSACSPLSLVVEMILYCACGKNLALSISG